MPPAAATAAAVALEAWSCESCGTGNAADRRGCFRCGLRVAPSRHRQQREAEKRQPEQRHGPNWTCLACDCKDNFARRAACHRCGVPKGESRNDDSKNSRGNKGSLGRPPRLASPSPLQSVSPTRRAAAAAAMAGQPGGNPSAPPNAGTSPAPSRPAAARLSSAQLYAEELKKVGRSAPPSPTSPVSAPSPAGGSADLAASPAAVPKEQEREQLRGTIAELAKEIEALSKFPDPDIQEVVRRKSHTLSQLKEQLAALRPARAQVAIATAARDRAIARVSEVEKE